VVKTNGNAHSKCVYLKTGCLVASPFSSFIGLLEKEIVEGKMKKGSTLIALTVTVTCYCRGLRMQWGRGPPLVGT
jgi:hypothetical protein